jgi:hypothetical protein
MGSSSRTFTISLNAGTGSQLESLAKSLAPGESVEFNTNQNQWALNASPQEPGGEQTIYWTHKFYWDEVNREAQGIWIGVYFGPFRHSRYLDASSEWVYRNGFHPAAEWGMATTMIGPPASVRGHAFEWHMMDPDGTYWVKRSEERRFQFVRRSEWSTAPWPAVNVTPEFISPHTADNWPEQLDYHVEMDRAILRWGSTVVSFDFRKFVASSAWDYQVICSNREPGPILPIMPQSSKFPDKCSTRYCHALKSMIFFGHNYGASQDHQHLLRADGTIERLPNFPPRFVVNGNQTLTTFGDEYVGVFIDDPLKQSAYIVEHNTSSNLNPRRVWKMRNVGTSWDGTWDEVGTTDVLTNPRSDLKSSGTRPAFCPIPNYGVIWVLRQRNDDGGLRRIDSFLWKPPV